MRSRGKSIALSTAAVGLLVLSVALIAGKDRMREEWYLYRLQAAGDKDAELEAAVQLAR